MVFHSYVYTLVSDDVGCTLGTYPNFKQAYERLEEITNGKVIYDCCDKSNINLKFEAIEVVGTSFGRIVRVNKYSIYRNLLHVENDNELVSFSMADKLEKEFERKTKNAKYKLNAEVV